MIEVVGPNRVRIQVDTAQIDDPGQARSIVKDDLIGSSTRGKGQRGDPEPIRAIVRGPLLEERLGRRPVHESLECHRAPPDATQRTVGHGEVVLDEVQFRHAGLGKKHLARVRDRDLTVIDPKYFRLRFHR